MRTRVFSALFAIVFLSACAASVDPAMQRRIVDAFNRSSDATYDATAAVVKPMPFAVGQYIVLGNTDGEERTISKTAIVGRDGDAWTLEITTLSPTGETAMQMKVRGLDKVQETMDPDDIDILSLKLRDREGQVQNIDGMALSLMKGQYAKALTGIAMKYEIATTTGSVKVPAGTFNGCTKATSKVETMFGDYESEGFIHPKVPLSGIVRSVMKDNGVVTELLEFGTNARSTF